MSKLIAAVSTAAVLALGAYAVAAAESAASSPNNRPALKASTTSALHSGFQSHAPIANARTATTNPAPKLPFGATVLTRNQSLRTQGGPSSCGIHYAPPGVMVPACATQ